MRVELKAVCVVTLAAIAVTAVSRPARADVSVALSWRSEASVDRCISERALRATVEDKLGRKPFVEHGKAQIVVEGEEFVVSRGRFRARVTERDRRGEVLGMRELEAQSCPSLSRAATLIVALILDPYLTGSKKVQDEAPEPAQPPSPAIHPWPLPQASPLETAASPPGRSDEEGPPPYRSSGPIFGLALRAGFGTTIGVLPSASATAFVGARLESRCSRWSFDWQGSASLPQRLQDGPVSGDFSALGQRVQACITFARRSSSAFDGCGGGAAEVVLPSTTGMGSGSDRWRLLLGPTAAVALDQRAGAGFGRVELGVLFPLRAYAFSYVGVEGERRGFYATQAVVFFLSLSGGGRLP